MWKEQNRRRICGKSISGVLPSSDSSGHENGAATVAEEFQGALTLALGTVSVNRGGREALVDEEV